MTDKEKAIDYARTECCNSCTDSCQKKNKCKMFCNVRNAVLYGLAEGREENEKLNKKIRRYEEMLGSMFASGNMMMQEQSKYEELRRL